MCIPCLTRLQLEINSSYDYADNVLVYPAIEFYAQNVTIPPPQENDISSLSQLSEANYPPPSDMSISNIEPPPPDMSPLPAQQQVLPVPEQHQWAIYPSNLSTIIGLIQLNALNFHTNALLLRINNTWLLVYHSIGLLLHTRLIALLLLPKALSNIGLNQVKLQPLPTTRNHHILSSQFHFHSSGLVYFSPTGNILNLHTQVLKFRLSATSNPVPMLSTNNTYLLLRSHALLLMTKPMSKDLT